MSSVDDFQRDTNALGKSPGTTGKGARRPRSDDEQAPDSTDGGR